MSEVTHDGVERLPLYLYRKRLFELFDVCHHG